MNQSEEITELAKALIKVQGALTPAAIDAQNKHLNHRYSSLGAMWETARQLLLANGLAVVQMPGYIVEHDGPALTIETTLLHESGQWLSNQFVMPLVKRDPQGVGSGITYGRRYAFSALLGIVSEEDTDGQDHRDHRPPPPRAQNPRRLQPLTPPEEAGPPFEHDRVVTGEDREGNTARLELTDEEMAQRRHTIIERINAMKAEIQRLEGQVDDDNYPVMDEQTLIGLGSAYKEQLSRLQQTRAAEEDPGVLPGQPPPEKPPEKPAPAAAPASTKKPAPARKSAATGGKK